MVAEQGKSPAVPGFRLVADFLWLYTFRYVCQVVVYTSDIPDINKQIYS